VRPNPNLGTIEKGPFAAVQVVAGDLGTKGGLLSDEYARVLREDGSVIDGLYVSGNNSASVMGRTYPGPGSTLGPAAVFGYIAAKHIASSWEDLRWTSRARSSSSQAGGTASVVRSSSDCSAGERVSRRWTSAPTGSPVRSHWRAPTSTDSPPIRST